MTTGLVWVTYAILLVFCPAPGEQPAGVPPRILNSLDYTARSLARTGRTEEVAELIEILAELGHPTRSIAKLEAKCKQAAARSRESSKPQPSLSRKIGQAADRLAALLPERTAETRTALARLILRLDSEQTDAQNVLGRVLHDGIFGPPEAPAIRKRRGAIQLAIQKVRRMTFDIAAGESPFDIFPQLVGHQGSTARWGVIELHSVWSAERSRLILKDVLRALALSAYLRSGELALPAMRKGRSSISHVFIHVDTDERYQKAIDIVTAQGKTTKKDADEARLLGGWYTSYEGQSVYLDKSGTEAMIKATILGNRGEFRPFFAYKGTSLACLTAGHLNWLCLTIFGTSLPSYAWYEVTEENLAQENRRYAGENSRSDRERSVNLRLTKSSLVGCRSWLARLTAARQDPPWARCLEFEDSGQVEGAFLLKSTIVAEYLHERGDLDVILAQTSAGAIRKAQEAAADPARAAEHGRGKVGGGIEENFAAVVGESTADFDARWREWLLPEPSGLVQRLVREAACGDVFSDGELRVLCYLDELREAAWDGYRLGAYFPLKIEPALSKGALAHAAYLDRYPDQAAAWPAAHEEFSDREGFSPEGCSAGLHSVIAPGAYQDNPEGALDAWMGTFYHRTPLLNPGLVRVGWGASKGCAVLDVGTLVLPTEADAFIIWPPRNHKNVPRRFEPELPNPVPGADQSNWGYPITLQRYTVDQEPRVVMRLFEGTVAAPDEEVECHFSTPSEPTNPELAPANDFCLIPKARLKAVTTYTVEAVDVLSGKAILWSFTTGK